MNRNFKFIFSILAMGLLMSSCQPSSIESKNSFASTSPCTADNINESPCKVETTGTLVGTTINSDVTSWENASASTKVTANIPKGFYDNKSCLLTDSNLNATQILFGKSIFGVTGGFTGTYSGNILSQAYRNPGSVPIVNNDDNQSTSTSITLAQETTTYAGANLPSTSGLTYRDIPDGFRDDEGYTGISCIYAIRPTVTCGTAQTTVSERIADCLNLNGSCSDVGYITKSTCEAAAKTWTSTAIWDGSLKCNAGQGLWKLVTRSAANKEVWQDSRTGILWSSQVSSSVNWCRASGNVELAPVTYYQSCNTTVAGHSNCATSTAINGNGSIGSITGGSSSTNQTVRVIFSSSTSFTVVSSTGGGCTGGGAQTIGAGPGSVATYSVNNICSFTITQGSIPFAANDKFFLSSTAAGSFSCVQGASSNLQPGTGAISLCTEGSGLSPSGETWTSSGYMTAKGGMGKNSTPSIAWRLPTISDYNIAELNGIRMVMPDMGQPSSQRVFNDGSPGGSSYEWSASVYSSVRYYSWIFGSDIGYVSYSSRNVTYAARCVGR
ncbi:MAG: hypothetical protein B7Y39_08350 [Bdellovibrio sp. 28-41-41]|nr:MAG: hypothetical protein B7Y39_08350 [Bdellovibrio sp. 28-41-41]